MRSWSSSLPFAVLAASVLTALAMGCATSPAGGLASSGAQAPSFSAPDQTGAVRTLEEFRGRKLVLFFYPKDGTPGCTREACAFRDAWAAYRRAGIAVVGISADDVASHARFASEHNLPFSLLSDTDGALARAYGVPLTFGLAQRVTFLIDDRGVVQKAWPDVDPGVHAREVLSVAAPDA